MGDENGKTLIKQVITFPEENGYIPIVLTTARGNIDCRFYPAGDTDSGVIWVGGVGGDFDSPAKNLYPKLCQKLQGDRIASLRVQFRYPHVLEEAVYDVIAGIEFLETTNISKLALIGHSFGGAVVIQTAVIVETVLTVVTLATQNDGADIVSELPAGRSILLIHGTNDTVLSESCSRHIYSLAHEPKELVIIEKTDHNLDESADEVEEIVYNWIVSSLKT